MQNSSRVYKRCIRHSIVKQRRTEANRIRNLKTTNPKEYWKILNDKKSKMDVNVSSDDLMEHFKNLNKDDNEPGIHSEIVLIQISMFYWMKK